jgi:hypothetical protein
MANPIWDVTIRRLGWAIDNGGREQISLFYNDFIKFGILFYFFKE